jgi:hypothetical protein
MKYYVFTIEDNDDGIKYGFIKDDVISPENLESIKASAFAVLDSLPPSPANSTTGRHGLGYNEETKEFYWIELPALPSTPPTEEPPAEGQ